jgi:hypothetical protein
MGLGDSEIVVRFRARAAIYLFSSLSRSTTAAHISERQGRVAGSSLPSSAELKSAWSYTSTPPYVSTAWCLIKGRDNFKRGKTQTTLVPNQASHHKYVWESGGTAPTFLTSSLDGSEWSASRPCSFIPRDRGCGTHYIRDWVGPTANLFAPAGNWTTLPQYSSLYPSRYNDLTIPVITLHLLK